MSRSGFNQQRLGRIGLDAPGVTPTPPVSGSSNVANQIRGILSEAGRSVQIAGVIRAEDRAREDRENIGIAQIEADKQYAPLADSLIEDLRTRVRNGDDGALTDEGLAAAVESRVGSAVSKLGLNAAGEERFRLALTSRLTNNAFGLRREIQDEYRVEQVTNIAAGFSGVQSDQDFDEIVSALREANPDLSESDINRLAMPSLEAAAATGNERLFNSLASKLPDGPEKQVAKARLTRAVRNAEIEADQLAYESIENSVYDLLETDNFSGAEAALTASGISGKDEARLRSVIDAKRENKLNTERNELRTDLANAIYTHSVNGDGDAIAETVANGVRDGIIELHQTAEFNAMFASQMTDRLSTTLRVATVDLRNATTERQRDAALGSIDDVLVAAEDALRRGTTEFGGISQNQYDKLESMAAPVLQQMFNEQAKQEYVKRLVKESDTITGANFDDLVLPGETVSGKEIAQEVASAKWASLTERIGPEEMPGAISAMSDWLASNPEAVLPEWQNENRGAMERLWSAALSPDQPERLAAAKDTLARTAALIQANPEVARRHMPADMVEVLDYLTLINDVIPLDDDAGIVGVLSAIASKDGPVRQVALSKDDEKAIRTALSNAGIKDSFYNYSKIEAEAMQRARTLANVFPNRMENIAKRVGDYYKVNWAKADNYAINISQTGLGDESDYKLAAEIVRGFHGHPDAVFRQDALGRWTLYEPGADTPIDSSIALDNSQLADMTQAWQHADRVIREREGMQKAGVKRAASKTGGTLGLGTLFGDTVLALPGEAFDAAGHYFKSRNISSILRSQHETWTEQYIDSNSVDLSGYEKYAVEMHRTGRITKPSETARPDPIPRGAIR